MTLLNELRRPENRLSKARCTDLMDQAAAEIEHLTKRLDAARNGLVDLASRAHSHHSQTDDLRGL